ncbi:MAG: hypothetical protein ACYSWX_17250, partial [Planctomycetota bacterium]
CAEALARDRSIQSLAGGRTFWTERVGDRWWLGVREASGEDTRRWPLPLTRPVDETTKTGATSPESTCPTPIPSPDGTFVAIPATTPEGVVDWTIFEAEFGRPFGEFTTSRPTPLVWSSSSDAIYAIDGNDGVDLIRIELVNGDRSTVWSAQAGTAITDLRATEDGTALIALTNPEGRVTRIDLEGGPARDLGSGVRALVGVSGPGLWTLSARTDGQGRIDLVDLTRPGSRPVAIVELDEGSILDATLVRGRIVLVQSGRQGPTTNGDGQLEIHSASGTLLTRVDFPHGATPIRTVAQPHTSRRIVVGTATGGGTEHWSLDVESARLEPAFESGRVTNIRTESLDRAVDLVAMVADDTPPDGFDGPLLDLGDDRARAPKPEALAWIALGGALIESSAPDAQDLEDPLPRLADRLIELELQPRIDALERLRARGEL